jgi:FeS assembly SUF system protein
MAEEQQQAGTAVPDRPLSAMEKTVMEAQIVEAIQTCYDPEIPVNIYELGLIYSIQIADNAEVEVRMTLTSPHCPAAQSLPPEVRSKVMTVQGVHDAKVTVVWDPPWATSMMSVAAKLELGIF